jgi:hypothetical protein
MKKSLATESVSSLLDAVDEVSSVVKSQLDRNSAFFFYVNPMNHTSHSFRRDPTRLFAFTHGRSHLLTGSQSDLIDLPLEQRDARTSEALSFTPPKWIKVADSVGSQACLDVVPGGQVASPGRSQELQAFGDLDVPGGYMRDVSINRYRGRHGRHGVGLRIAHSYSHANVFGKTVVILSPDLEPLSAVSHVDTMAPLAWPNIKWNVLDGEMPENIANAVDNTATNILSLAKTADQMV